MVFKTDLFYETNYSLCIFFLILTLSQYPDTLTVIYVLSLLNLFSVIIHFSFGFLHLLATD